MEMEEDEVRKPRNTGELLWWFIFEPLLLKAYSDIVKGWQNRLWVMLMPMLWFAVFGFFTYVLLLTLICGLDLPYYFPSSFKSEIAAAWLVNFAKNWSLLFQLSIWGFLAGLAVGLASGLVGGLRDGLTFGLAVGLAFSLAVSWIFGLVVGLAAGLTVSLAVGLAVGLMFGLAVSLVVGLAGGLASGLAGGLVINLPSGLGFSLMVGLVISFSNGLVISFSDGLVISFSGGLTSLISCWIFYYRFYLYLPYVLSLLFKKYSLSFNPHSWDGIIFFPLPSIQSSFQKEAYDSPKEASTFSQFLFKQRPLQKKLAWLVRLAAIAGQWRQQRSDSDALKNFPILDRETLWHEDKLWFINLSRLLIPLPTTEWHSQIETTRLALLDVEQESNIRRKVAYFKIYRAELDKLYDLALQQPRIWGQYFVQALELWQKSATEKLRELELEAEAEEPIAPNLYRGGEKLKPEDGELFLGRADLRDAFKNRVLTAAQMPLFFIQGQRRVGKSSLIAFLPRILGRKFQVVAFDMQEHPGLPVPELLQKLWQRIHEGILRKAAPTLEMPEAWVPAWQLFREALDALAQEQETRLVIAIDEYEVLHQILQTRPEEAAQLLGAIRAWSQSQNKVVLLFAGADFLSELRSPNWSEYFVQAERLLVDYLNRSDSFKLINLVGLKYPKELLEKIYQETQGHPCLLQKICREIVTIVNKQGRESRAVTEADYQMALKQALLMPDDGVVNLFWNQFCENRGLKPTVRQILNGEQPTDERAILVLEDHQFIVMEDGQWRLRVPLFELWLRRYQVT